MTIPVLPSVGGDDNTWGTKLDTWLTQLPFFNVLAYSGIDPTGTTDSTTAIASAMSDANAAGGGTVYFPPGMYLTGNQTLYSKIHLLGAGIEATIIKLKNGSNADLLSASTGSINLSASFGTGSTGGIYNWSLQNLTLDGNKANQSSGTSYCLREYGYGFIIHNVRMRNGYSGGWLSDWNGGSNSPGVDSMEAQISNLKIHDCNNIGLQFGGPHDSQFVNFISYTHSRHCLHMAPNSVGTQFTSCHFWSPGLGVHAVAALIEANGIYFDNCQSEGSDGAQIAFIANLCMWFNGRIFAAGSGASTAAGLQIGQQAGQTPYYGMINQSSGVTTAVAVSQCLIDTLISDCVGTNGAIWLANDGGANIIEAVVAQSSGSAVTGTPNGNTDIHTVVTGLTPTGTLANTSYAQFSGNLYVNKDSTLEGSVDVFGYAGLGTGHNTSIMFLVTPTADNKKGFVAFPHSSTQTATLFEAQDATFAPVFTIDKSGNGVFSGHVSVGSVGTSYNTFSVYDGSGHPILNVDTTDSPAIVQLGIGATFKMLDGSGNNLFSVLSGQFYFGASFDVGLYRASAGVLEVDNAVKLSSSGSTLYSGSGAPSNSNGNNGDYYFRTDTPSTTNQRIYVKSSGSWVGVV